ncbi:SERTA domain-containing protein 3 [Paramarasmius palmivorus]|uniref:SERTA domain-containing protein 3 n=1 Tax=Paramarasmius palmivorus TaxID=297713 RepID=A0AAW0AU92_9AGAR
MPNPGAFKGSRLSYLESHIAGYRKSIEEDVEQEFLANVTRVYNHLFPETLPPDTERSAEEIDAVSPDNVEDVVFTPPIQKPGQGDEDFAREMREYEELKRRYAFRRDQIARWFNYRRGERAARDPSRKEPDALDRLLGKLSGTTQPPRRKVPAFTAWAQAHPEIVEPLIQQRILELEVAKQQAEGDAAGNGMGKKGDSDGEKKKGKFIKKGKEAFVAVCQDVVHGAFEKLPPETRKEFGDKARAEATEREEAYKAALRQPPATEPAARQSAIERVPAFVQPILDGMSAATGWSFTLLAGGPEPADGGRLNIISSHSAVTAGSPLALNFGAASRTNYKKFIIPIFAQYLQRVYTIEECRSRALPPGAPSLASLINEETDGVSLDTVVLPPKLPQGASLTLPTPSSSSSMTGSTSSKDQVQTKAAISSVSSSSKSTSKPTAAAPSTANAVSGTTTQPKKSVFRSSMRMSTGGKPPKLPPQATCTTAPPSSQKHLPQSNGPAGRMPVDQTDARRRLAGSSRAAAEHPVQKHPNVQSVTRPRSASSPPSPSRNPDSSPVSTRPTPPRATRSPDRLSPITVPSSPPAPVENGSGGQDSPIDLDLVPSSSGSVIRTYRSPSRKAKGRKSLQSRSDVSPDPPREMKMSISDDEVEIADIDFTKQPGYEPDSVFYASLKRRRNSGSEPATKEAKKARTTLSAPATNGGKKKARTALSAPASNGGHSKKATPSATNGEHSQNVAASAPGGGPPSPPDPASSSFDVPTPAEAPEYVIRTLMLARAVGIDADFRQMLRLYLRIDSATGFTGSGQLPTYRRPSGIGAWIGRARSHKYRPDMSDLSWYYEEFFHWFKACMPDWRKDQKKGIRLTRDPNGNWDDLRLTGRNGIVSFIPALAWWKEAIAKLPTDTTRQKQYKAHRLVEYEGALDEIIYCFSGLAKNL